MATAPSAPPRDVATTFVSASSITLSWSVPEESSRNGEIRRYTVSVQVVEGISLMPLSTVQTVGSSERITLTGLQPFRSYVIRVAAETVALGPFSAPLNVSTLQDGELLDRVVQLTIEWVTVEAGIRVLEVLLHTCLKWCMNTSTPSFYYYSSAKLVPILLFAVPGTPQNFALNATNATTLRATWLPPAAGSLNGIIRNYRLVLRDQAGGRQDMVQSVAASLRSFTWTNLHPHFSYSVDISAATSAGSGPTVQSLIQMPEAGM